LSESEVIVASGAVRENAGALVPAGLRGGKVGGLVATAAPGTALRLCNHAYRMIPTIAMTATMPATSGPRGALRLGVPE